MSVLFNKIREEIENANDFDQEVTLRKMGKGSQENTVVTKTVDVDDIESINGKGYGTFKNGMDAMEILKENRNAMSKRYPKKKEKDEEENGIDVDFSDYMDSNVKPMFFGRRR